VVLPFLGSKEFSFTWHIANKECVVSWDGIFTSQHPLRFEVSAGTVLGGNNIIQWQETRATSITFSIPDSVPSTSRLKIYIIVRAIAAGGNYDDMQGSIILPE
jgi:hypothetical protein